MFESPVILLVITQVEYDSSFGLLLNRRLQKVSSNEASLEVKLLSSNLPTFFKMEVSYLVTQPLFNV
jgi:hypothetical protein